MNNDNLSAIDLNNLCRGCNDFMTIICYNIDKILRRKYPIYAGLLITKDKIFMESFGIDGITFFEECPDSISDAEFLNKRLKKLRFFLEDACPCRLLNGLKYKLYFFESERLDAQAYKRDSENYIIAFSTGTFKIIWENLNTIFKEKLFLIYST